jgi:hypothetical protein
MEETKMGKIYEGTLDLVGNTGIGLAAIAAAKELIDGVELGGVATFIGAGETSDISLFI